MRYKLHIEYVMLAVEDCTNVKEIGRKEKFVVEMVGIKDER